VASPHTPLGSKGKGKGIPGMVPAALANAIEDALTPFGVKITELPLKTEYIWRLLRKRMAGHALNFSRKVGESSLPYRADLLIQHSYYSSPWQMG
jgi:hypothetical protein